ncbi:hypothetical protein RHGRI_028751 [Rhododendron griersonianum]|uniref:Elongator complex protein 5 n=1 Tax=Rhododendron griersonianum TaxID=479676 RepID=A0AAV6IMJ4_9ERIC|nr:hypothetical protein RHGRI_028751 [Rhododendron griersonianum]
MAELICRALRDGALDGEHAPALTIKDSIDSPFGPHVFNHVLAQLSANILSAKSQSQLRVLDGYTDPLGWKVRLMECGNISNRSPEASNTVRLCNDVRDLDKLSLSIIELGRVIWLLMVAELVGQGKGRFSVAIDSRLYYTLSNLAGINSRLFASSNEIKNELSCHAMLSCYQVSCAFWLLHSDLHEVRVTAALEYMSSMLANIEPMARPTNVQRGNSVNLSLLEQNSNKGKFHARLKRRNGRVRLMSEEFCIEPSGIKFTAVSSDDGMITQSLVPKVST